VQRAVAAHQHEPPALVGGGPQGLPEPCLGHRHRPFGGAAKLPQERDEVGCGPLRVADAARPPVHDDERSSTSSGGRDLGVLGA
jgi:hypothetical protein